MVLKTLFNIEFLKGFILLVAEVFISCGIGSIIGITLGSLLSKSNWLSSVCSRLLPLGQWTPLIVFWCFPFWPTQDAALSVFALGMLTLIFMLALTGCYIYVSAYLMLGLDHKSAKAMVGRDLVLPGLLLLMVSQIWFGPLGWSWFSFRGETGPQAIVATYMATIFLIIFLLIILNKFVFGDFDETARIRAKVILREVIDSDRKWLGGSILVTLICLMVWYFLSAIGFYPLISSPANVVRATYHLFAGGPAASPTSASFHIHVIVSLVEIFGGLVVALGITAIVCRIMETYPIVGFYIMRLLPFTYFVPILFSLLLFVFWGGHYATWRILLAVASLSFYPLARAFWGLRSLGILSRTLLACADAMPFAVIGMLFGETLNSNFGLGFFMVLENRLKYDVANGLAAALILVAILGSSIFVFRYSGKHLYSRVSATALD